MSCSIADAIEKHAALGCKPVKAWCARCKKTHEVDSCARCRKAPRKGSVEELADRDHYEDMAMDLAREEREAGERRSRRWARRGRGPTVR